RPGRDDGRGRRAGAAPRAEGGPGDGDEPVQRAPGRARRGGPRARRAAALGGVHAGARDGRGRGDARGAHHAARPVRPEPRGAPPRVVPAQRAPLGATRPDRDELPRPARGPSAPARAGPRRRVGLRPRAPAGDDRDGHREGAAGRGARVLPAPARERRRAAQREVPAQGLEGWPAGTLTGPDRRGRLPPPPRNVLGAAGGAVPPPRSGPGGTTSTSRRAARAVAVPPRRPRPCWPWHTGLLSVWAPDR